jgi:hypothetical protein
MSHAVPPSSPNAHTAMPVDVAAWIDAHDPPELGAVERRAPAEVLAEQRAEHQPENGPVTALDPALDPALGHLVNNTGDDGGAATG